MAIESFDTLKTAIETWLIDDEIQTDVETFIQLAEARHRRELWIRQMRVTNPLISLTAGAWSVPLPDDYLKGIYFRFQNPVAGDGRRWLPPLRNSNDEDQTENSWSGSYGWRGPTSFTVTEDLVFDVPAHVNLTGELRYYKALTPLSAQNQSNALLERAPLDIRINALKAGRADVEMLWPEAQPLEAAPFGLRLPTGTPVEASEAWQDGLIEVQDHGSQWACAAVDAKPGETVIDLCAGAGGKTLALAAAMENRGTLIAADTDRGRLSRVRPRSEKGGAGMIERILLDPGKEMHALADYQGKADAVLVDAPCSGTGTWRRNPEARWRIDRDGVTDFAHIQSRLFGMAAKLVKPGGRIIFVVCSLLDEEGSSRVDAFLNSHQGWQADAIDWPIGRAHGKGRRLTPFHDGTDGFFIARVTSPN